MTLKRPKRERERGLLSSHPRDYFADKWVSHPLPEIKGEIQEKCSEIQEVPKINPNCRN
jgi:hypothetical protein